MLVEKYMPVPIMFGSNIANQNVVGCLIIGPISHADSTHVQWVESARLVTDLAISRLLARGLAGSVNKANLEVK